MVACGGTALTLNGYKESTKDVDLLVPVPEHYAMLLKLLGSLGYKSVTDAGFRHPNGTWIFELYKGQTIFQTELLDPIHEPSNHRVIHKYDKLTLGCLNPADLIISKMFRGTQIDAQDSVMMMKSEEVNLPYLAKRYRDTADYYYNPALCKHNLNYLIEEMELEGLNATALKEMNEQWNP